MKLKLSIIFIALFLCAGTVLAVETDWQGLDPNIGSGTLPNGVVVVAPTSSLATGTFHSQQTVQLTAANSNTIRYTLDGSAPACPSTGTLYAGAFTVNATRTLKAIACYQSDNSIASVLSTNYVYTFTCTTASIANGTVTAYPACTASCNSGYTLSGGACVANTSGGGSIGGGGGGGGGGSSSGSTPLTTPTGGFSVKINNDEARTLTRTVTLTLNGGVDAKNMSIVNGENFANASQETYSTSKQWTLTEGEEMKKVCARFYNQSGYYTSAVCDEIAFGTNTVIPTTGTNTNQGSQTGNTNQTNQTNNTNQSNHIAAIDALLYFKYGDVNPKIRQLQLELKKAGFLAQSVPLSNRYGEATREAVRKYQESLKTNTSQTTNSLSSMSREELLKLLLQLLFIKFGITL
ncbi:MAG: chitobiase/beta-hexosaminidase C-terminal domain-containing protein [Candidatus Paceibacterota bacterium]